MVTRATQIIDFGAEVSEEDGFIRLELDDELNAGDEEDEESAADFYPGSEIYFLVNYDDTIEIESVKSTSGSVEMLDTVSRDREADLLFTSEEPEQELEYIPAGDLSATWYGNKADLSLDNRIVSAVGSLPAYGKIQFPVNFLSCKLTAPSSVEFDDSGEYPIQIVVRYSSV